MTTALSVLDQRLSEMIGDWCEELVTIAIAASASIISTNLNKIDHARDDFVNGWWAYITDKANIAVERLIYDYATSTGACSVRGGNLATDGSNLATVRFYRYPYTAKVKAINEAIRDFNAKGLCQKKVDDRSLVGGNWLPDGHFEDWTSTAALRFYTKTGAGTFLKTATSQYTRGPLGTTSAKYTAAAAAGDTFYISSNSYPWLLDLAGQTIDFECWAYPEVLNDPSLIIVTYKADGTTQTLSSTTTAPAGKFTQLKLENQTINDDITSIVFYFSTATASKYVYWDGARVTGPENHRLLLPNCMQTGDLRQVYAQTSSNEPDPCDTLEPDRWEQLWDWNITHDGTYRYLWLPQTYKNYQIRLIGLAYLEALSAFTDTLSLDDPWTDCLLNYAAYRLFTREQGLPSGNDTSRFDKRAADYYRTYLSLKSSMEMKPSTTQRLPTP